MVAQSLPYCLLLSCMAGVFTVIGKAIVVVWSRLPRTAPRATSVPASVVLVEVSKDAVPMEDVPKENPRRRGLLLMVGFVISNVLANFCIFMAPWFGPVAIYWPTYIASQLIANLIIVGHVLKQEASMDKSCQVATLVIIASVVNLTVSGPGEPAGDQDIHRLILDNPVSLCWLSILVAAFVLSFGVMIWIAWNKPNTAAPNGTIGIPVHGSSKSGRVSQFVVEAIIFTVSITSSVLCATTSKMSSLLDSSGAEGIYRWVLIATTWFIIICWSFENVIEGSYVRSLPRFLPVVTFGSVLVNAATGLVVWEDSQVVASWTGYAMSLVLLAGGVYLISDLDLFQVQIEERQNFQHHLMQLRHLVFSIEENLSQTQIEMQLHPHQLKILEHSRSVSDDEGVPVPGFRRGISDPEVGARAPGWNDTSGDNAMRSSTSSNLSPVTERGNLQASDCMPQSCSSRKCTSMEMWARGLRSLGDEMSRSHRLNIEGQKSTSPSVDSPTRDDISLSLRSTRSSFSRTTGTRSRDEDLAALDIRMAPPRSGSFQVPFGPPPTAEEDFSPKLSSPGRSVAHIEPSNSQTCQDTLSV